MAKRSLHGRVAAASALAAAVASAATLIVAILVVDARATSMAEQRALSKAQAFVEELEVDLVSAGSVRQLDIQDEVREFSHGGDAIAVFIDGVQVAGTTPLEFMAADGCKQGGGAPDTWLTCRASSPSHGLVALFAQSRDDVLAHRAPLLAGGLLSLLVLLGGGVVSGVWVSRWSLRPLHRLREVLTQVDAAAPANAPLPRSGAEEIDAVAEVLDALLSRLAHEVERSRRFSADAAHEMRTPLTKLRTELELLAESRSSDASFAPLVRRTEALSTLLDRLLILASPEQALQRDALVSIAVVVEDVLESLDDDGGVRVEVRCEGDGVVLGDAGLLVVAIKNAVDNALKFSEGPVLVHVREEIDQIEVRVDDQGPGLDVEQQARAFEPFVRGRNARGLAGQGIGLSLVEHIVRAHRGSVAFVGTQPGAHLCLRIPRAPARPA